LNGTKTRHVNVVVACGPLGVMRSDIGLHNLKCLRKGIVRRMMRVLGRSGLMVVSLSPCCRGGFVGSETLLEQVQLNFSF
jgi:hypothetical protein